MLITSNALLVSALSEFWLYKVQLLNSYIEIIGITGGIVKIFQIVNNTITRIMLKVLRKFIKIENRHQHELELNQINIKRTRSGTI